MTAPTNFCEILQTVDDPLFDPQVVPVSVVSTVAPLFVNKDGTWVEVLKSAANINTQSDGTVTVNLPYPTICYSPSVGTIEWKWTTDGFTFQGEAPTVPGPLTLKDLVSDYSWTVT
jgi:hypothetical protein